jgi:hypothetical protein
VKTETKKRAFGFSEFAEMFSISRDSAKRLWRSGMLATITIGGRRLIPLSEVERIERQGIGTPRRSNAQVVGRPHVTTRKVGMAQQHNQSRLGQIKHKETT